MASVKSILKLITVTSSATLMAGFVAFKAGAFTQYFNANESYSSPPDSLKNDSIKTVDPMISSSKFMILEDQETLKHHKNDSILDLFPNDVIIPSSKSGAVFDAEDMPFMGSSKSLHIFTPRDSHLLAPKDTLTDSLKGTKTIPNQKYNKK